MINGIISSLDIVHDAIEAGLGLVRRLQCVQNDINTFPIAAAKQELI